MNKCPKLGARVKTRPDHRFGEITGTVMAIYPRHRYDEIDDDATDEDIHRAMREPLPERGWHVGVKVDILPANWSYVGTDRFAPEVGELVAIK